MTHTIERAAGGFVFRKTARGREVLLIDDAYGKVAFPKGHLERGETWAEAAIREILEETGIEARVIAPLGRLEYPITRDGQPIRKQVRFFLLEAIDESDEPTHQEEEVAGAYYLPWDEARLRHAKRGYANWAWVFEKADALYAWHENHLESKWRNHTVGAGGQSTVTDTLWAEANPIVQRLIDAVYAELTITAPELIAGFRSQTSVW